MAAARRLSYTSWASTLADRTTYRLGQNSGVSRFLAPCCRQAPSSDAGSQFSDCPVEKLGFEAVGGRDFLAGSLFPRLVGRWSEVPRLSCGIVSVYGGVCVDSFGDGARMPGTAFQSRGLAAKAKKAKSSKVEHVDPTEDIGATAKANSLKMMETALDVLSREHSKLRTGRASAGMLDHITVEAHGVRTPLNHIAAVTVSGLQTLNVLPYDASMVKEVEKAILHSPMGLNPQVDGATLTVPLPRLTKEHCETMCKLVSKSGEAAKLTIRRARKEALDAVKSSGDLSKDEMKRFEKEVEESTKKYTKSIDETCKNKEKEIMA